MLYGRGWELQAGSAKLPPCSEAGSFRPRMQSPVERASTVPLDIDCRVTGSLLVLPRPFTHAGRVWSRSLHAPSRNPFSELRIRLRLQCGGGPLCFVTPEVAASANPLG